MQTKYMSFEFCLICILLSVMFSFGTFFILHLEAKSIEVILSSPKSMLSLISTKHSQVFVKSLFDLCEKQDKSHQHIETDFI